MFFFTVSALHDDLGDAECGRHYRRVHSLSSLIKIQRIIRLSEPITLPFLETRIKAIYIEDRTPVAYVAGDHSTKELASEM
jgi:hypothetical protein